MPTCNTDSPYKAHRWGRVGSIRVCLDWVLPEPMGPHRPPGFMTLGTLDDETILVRVDEVAAFCEGARSGALLTLRCGRQVDVRESISEIAEAMKIEEDD